MARLELREQTSLRCAPRLSSFHWRSDVGIRAKRMSRRALPMRQSRYSLSIGNFRAEALIGREIVCLEAQPVPS